jgi:hypothetical protein
MSAEIRYLFTLERRTNAERRAMDSRQEAATDASLYERLNGMRNAVASDRRRKGRRVTDRWWHRDVGACGV